MINDYFSIQQKHTDMSNINSLFKRTSRFIFSLLTCALLICLCTNTLQAQSTAITKIAFKKDRFNRIFIPVKIEKDSLTLLLSTYAKTLRLTPYFMETMALYPSWSLLALKDKTGRKAARMIFYLPKLDIGNLKFRNEETIVNYAFPDTIITGTTGTLLVYQYNWKIENDKNMISIAKTPFNPTNVFTTIKYSNDSYPQVPVQIGDIKDNFVIDFGSGTNFQVSGTTPLGKQIIASYDLRPVVTLTTNYQSRKVIDTIYEVTVPSLLFNGIELKDQKITLSTAAPHHVVGSAFLGKYNIIMNNSRKRKIANVLILENRTGNP